MGLKLQSSSGGSVEINAPVTASTYSLTAPLENDTLATRTYASNFGQFRNRIINGDFSINQRGASGTVTLSAGAYGHDRWKAGASGCTYKFAMSNGLTTITITAGSLQQVIEDKNVPAGTNTVVMSWTGTAQGKIGAGSYAASGVTASVTGGSNLTVEFNTGTLTLVQLEKGSITTPFEYRPYGTELALCQRYYQKSYNYSVIPGTNSAGGGQAGAYMNPYAVAGNTLRGTIFFKVNMRAAPTVTTYNPETGTAGYWCPEGSGASDNATSGVTFVSDNGALIYSTSAPINGIYYISWKAEIEL